MEHDFEYSKIEERLAERASQRRMPFSGGFELTPYCNLACKMCYVKENTPGLSVLSGEQWIDIGKQAVQMGVMGVILTGGEPLLHPDFKTVYRELKLMGLVLTINTNGTLIDEEMADFFAADKPRRINISLYGGDCACYQTLCGVGQAFDRTIRAIELLQERNVAVKVNITPNTINYRHLKRMLEICAEYKVSWEIAPYLFEPIRKCTAEKQQYRLSSEQMADIMILQDMAVFPKKDFVFRRILCYEMLERFEENAAADETQEIQCRAGISSFWVCWDGSMNLCAAMTMPHADVLSLGFEGAWEQAKAYSESIRVPARCSRCSLNQFCHPCAAVSYHETGKYSEIPQTLCQATQEYARLMSKGIRREKRASSENEIERNKP